MLRYAPTLRLVQVAAFEHERVPVLPSPPLPLSMSKPLPPPQDSPKALSGERISCHSALTPAHVNNFWIRMVNRIHYLLKIPNNYGNRSGSLQAVTRTDPVLHAALCHGVAIFILVSVFAHIRYVDKSPIKFSKTILCFQWGSCQPSCYSWSGCCWKNATN